MKNFQKFLASTLFLSTTLFAEGLGISVGVHDFMVQNIQDNVGLVHNVGSSSNTFGGNIGIWYSKHTQGGINILAKAEVFRDYDKDELDFDHIPIWFDYLLTFDGKLHDINEANRFRWLVYLDNRQNTVSCIERTIRQMIGAGYEYHKSALSAGVNLYAGFYYIELDDDTPVARGYTREELDDGEAAHALEAFFSYDFNNNWHINATIRHYAANTGGSTLETDSKLHISYSGESFFMDNATLNLKIDYRKYDYSRFNTRALPVVPWDNDTLIQAYVLVPISLD